MQSLKFSWNCVYLQLPQHRTHCSLFNAFSSCNVGFSQQFFSAFSLLINLVNSYSSNKTQQARATLRIHSWSGHRSHYTLLQLVCVRGVIPFPGLFIHAYSYFFSLTFSWGCGGGSGPEERCLPSVDLLSKFSHYSGLCQIQVGSQGLNAGFSGGGKDTASGVLTCWLPRCTVHNGRALTSGMQLELEARRFFKSCWHPRSQVASCLLHQTQICDFHQWWGEGSGWHVCFLTSSVKLCRLLNIWPHTPYKEFSNPRCQSYLSYKEKSF